MPSSKNIKTTKKLEEDFRDIKLRSITEQPTTAPTTAPIWKQFTRYKIGDLCTFEGDEHTCTKDHISQVEWKLSVNYWTIN